MNKLYDLDIVHCNVKLFQTQNPQSHEESVEVLMIALRRMAEHKQREHSHISDGGKGAHRSDVSVRILSFQ